KGRSVVLDLEIVQPVEIVQHEAGAKAGGVPIMQIPIDLLRFGGEVAAGMKEPSIVLYIVHSHFETLFDKLGPQFYWFGIAPFWNKNIARSKADCRFQL